MMSSFYIHIPFCKQACYYCDFHFSTSLKKKDEFLKALLHEIYLRKNEVKDVVETIYFGGGTPSVLSQREIDSIIDSVYQNYNVVSNPEITLEANPDDLTPDRILELSKSKVNRLSIGVQSFFQDDLLLMNRAHNARQAKEALALASKFFNNISIDLIYGIPEMSNQRWLENIEMALSFNIPHISSYALTVEPKTALKKLIEKGEINQPKDEVAEEHFRILVDKLTNEGFIQYEFSNFGKPGFFSVNNTSYWLGKTYLGVGPSAHSFDGNHRSWNIANNSIYISKILNNELPSEKELLSVADRYNEYVMTGLRTIWGVNLVTIKTSFGEDYCLYLLENAQEHILKQNLLLENDVLKISLQAKFLSDGIASDLFYVED